MFSNKSDEWSTPQNLYNELDAEFHFNLDPCANEENHKCENYYSKSDDGLIREWGGYRVFCNPPYSGIKEWCEKAYNEVFYGDCELVVMLVPARTDTKWFHEWCYGKAEIRFIKGRLKFGGATNNAPFPSILVIYRKNK